MVKFVGRYFKPFLPFIFVFTLCRVTEIVGIINNHPDFVFNINSIATSFAVDTVVALVILIVLCPFYFLFSLFCNSGSKAIKLILFIIIIFQICFSVFFTYNLYPLDNVLFLYSFKQILTILLSYSSFSLLLTSTIVIIILSYYLLTKYLNKIIRVANVLALLLIIISIVVFAVAKISGLYNPGNYLLKNKSAFFYLSLINNNCKIDKNSIETNAAIIKRLTLQNPDNVKYPLERDFNIDNVLGPFFTTNNIKPDIVFLFVEGLSRNFSGSDAKFGSYTPFLDSLAAQSLYFCNFMSCCERTYGILPNVLGSLPPAVNGFMSQINTMPNHNSIIKILDSNGYYSSFFYGSNSDFDNMDYFLFKQGIDTIIDKNSYGQEFKQVGFYRYSDFDMFNKSFKIIENINQPKLLIYLTMGIHEPFVHVTGNFFDKQLLVNKKQSMLNNNMLKSVLECDSSLHLFFDKYKQQPRYKNTIFVITGDHSPSAINIDGSIDNFYVPLIIYSPMLKKNSRIKAVSSHIDILPTILSLLKSNYDIECPQKCHFMSYGLDTATVFYSNRFIPLSTVNRTVSKALFDTVFFDGNNAFVIYNKFETKLLNNNVLVQKLKNELNNFNKLDNYILNNNALMPGNIVDNTNSRVNFNLFDKPTITQKMVCYKSNTTDSALVDTLPQFINIYNYVIDTQNTNYINISLNTDIKLIKGHGTPLFVVSVETDSGGYYRSFNLINPRMANKWHNQQCTFTINKSQNKIKPGNIVKIYIWNPAKCVYKISKPEFIVDK